MSDDAPIVTLAAPHELEVEIKKSRFLARAAHVDSPEAADAQREAWSIADATHNCWAWRIGERLRFSDDGEPGGTAGRPILGAIEGQGVDQVLVVVTRWFGGIKLGAGGLVRAYGGTAASCLREAERREIWPTVELRVALPFDGVSALYPLLERFEADRDDEQYTAQGVEVTVRLQTRHQAEFQRALIDATRGKAQVDPA